MLARQVSEGLGSLMRGDVMTERRITRRAFAVATVAAGATMALGATSALAAPSEGGPRKGSFSADRYADGAEAASASEQYGFHVDSSACTGCGHCERACRKAHGFADGEEAFRKVRAYVNAGGEEVRVSSGCMHCEEPSCMTVCPAGAISKGAGGIVSVDPDRCIGCRYCYQACPFGVPRYTSEGMKKCDACLSVGVVAGQEPNCARSCKFDALHYGKLSDLAAAYPEAKRPESTTQPAYLIQ